MKRVGAALVLATVVLVLGAQLHSIPVPAPSASSVVQQDASQSQGDSEKTSDVRLLTEKVMRCNGQYVLLDSIGMATFPLDDQENSRQLEGEAVRVTGLLKQAASDSRL
jgi:hypothetical protein